MKRTLVFMGIAAVVLFTGCNEKTEKYVYLGQLYGTWDHGGQEKIKGKVSKFKQTHFWAAEENGKIVKGKVLTVKEREALANMGRDITEEYNESGTVLRSTFFDENGKVLQDCRTNADKNILLGSEYYSSDTLRAKVKYRYEGKNPVEISAYNPKNDTVFLSVKYEYDKNGFLIKTQSYNYKGQPQGYTIRNRNEKGQVVQAQNYSKDGKLTSQSDFTYNSKGERITHHQQIIATGQVIDYTFSYEYDKRGNYSAIIFYKDGKPLIYRAREIEYYD